MPKTDGFINRDSKNGEFTAHITRENNLLLTIYCKLNGFNKTSYINKLVADDMATKFSILREASNGNENN